MVVFLAIHKMMSSGVVPHALWHGAGLVPAPWGWAAGLWTELVLFAGMLIIHCFITWNNLSLL